MTQQLGCAVFTYVLGKSLFTVQTEQMSLQLVPANLSPFSCLITSSNVTSWTLSEVLDGSSDKWEFIYGLLCAYPVQKWCVSIIVLTFFYWHCVNMWMYSMLLEKESGIRGFEIQKSDCKMILESVNNTKMKCTSITVLYINFKCYSSDSITVQFMQCTLWLNRDWCFLIAEIVKFFCLCHLRILFFVFWISSWRNTFIQFLQCFLTVLQ